MTPQFIIIRTHLKLSLLFLFIIVCLSGCSIFSDDIFILQEYEKDPSLYYVVWSQVKDEREHSILPSIRCQIDMCSKEEIEEQMSGLRITNNSNYTPVLETSLNSIVHSEISEFLSQYPGRGEGATLLLKITCIGFGYGSINTFLNGELTYNEKLLWKANGESRITLDSWYQEHPSLISGSTIDWNSLVISSIKNAVSNCLSKLPYIKKTN